MRTVASRLDAEILRLLADRATAGPWEVFGSWVTSVDPAPAPDSFMGKGDPDVRRAYGGELVCESVSNADALLIAATRNLLPSLVAAHLAALEEIGRLEHELHYSQLREKEAVHIVEMERSDRYRQPEYPLMRIRRDGVVGWRGVGPWSGGAD